jgi:hypothetical protein
MTSVKVDRASMAVLPPSRLKLGGVRYILKKHWSQSFASAQAGLYRPIEALVSRRAA